MGKETKNSKKDTKKKVETKEKAKKEEKVKVEKAENKVEEKNEFSKTEKGKKSSKIKLIATVIAIIVVLGLIAYVANTITKKANYVAPNPVATIEVENFGTIKVELYPQYAPNTVTNFIALANNGAYDGLTFHRTIPEFMIQGGDLNGDGSGNATLDKLGLEKTDAYSIKGEFVLNGYTQNTLKHKKGTISMARGDYSSQGSTTLTKKGYDSASSQFFITTEDSYSLDGAYAAFGEVVEGMEIVEKIANVEVETRESNPEDTSLTADRPVNPPVIKSIRVETNGVEYGLPETLEPYSGTSY